MTKWQVDEVANCQRCVSIWNGMLMKVQAYKEKVDKIKFDEMKIWWKSKWMGWKLIKEHVDEMTSW